MVVLIIFKEEDSFISVHITILNGAISVSHAARNNETNAFVFSCFLFLRVITSFLLDIQGISTINNNVSGTIFIIRTILFWKID